MYVRNTVHKQALDAYVDMLPISILHAHTDVIHTRRKYKEHKRICTHNRDIVYTHSTETLHTFAHTYTIWRHSTHAHTQYRNISHMHTTQRHCKHPCAHTLKQYGDITRIHTQYRDAVQTYPHNTYNIDATRTHKTHTHTHSSHMIPHRHTLVPPV